MKRRVLIATALLLVNLPAVAQFYSYGSDPASLRWKQIRTEDYRVIYPKGMDSLAKVYARLLEQVKMPVGEGVGRYPNQNFRKPMPVILHGSSAISNGMVTWTPRRMELLTTPDCNEAFPQLWERQLAIHESRHVAQMQFVNEGPYKPWGWIMGQLFAGAAVALYPEPAFLEGDAVMAETALSNSGRGRSADFMEYFRMNFTEAHARGLKADSRNDFTRDWWRWRYGSQRLYTPDYYKAGYLKVAGLASLYDRPELSKDYFDNIFARKYWPWPIFNWQKTVKEDCGKDFKTAMTELTDSLTSEWVRNNYARGPFTPIHQISRTPRMHSEYLGASVMDDGCIYAVRSGMDRIPSLVRIAKDGSEKRIRSFSYNTGGIKADPASGHIYWSEIIRDPRWEQRSWSDIYCTDSLGLGRHRITRHQRMFNPAPNHDGSKLAVVEYPMQGGSMLTIIDSHSGERISSTKAPDGMQIIETDWIGTEPAVVAITAEGAGIYLPQQGFKTLLPAQTATIKQMMWHDSRFFFTSDRSGVNELYELNPETLEIHQKTVSLNGSAEFHFNEAGDSLYSAILNPHGRLIYSSPSDSLVHIPISNFASSRYQYGTANRLTHDGKTSIDWNKEISISEAEDYSKFSHLLHFHSWLPVFVDIDDISALSFDSIFASAGLGATVFFQNELSTLSGQAGYHAIPLSSGKWSHDLMARITYTGLYPVIEGEAHINNSHPAKYHLEYWYRRFKHYQGFVGELQEELPGITGKLRIYVPLSFSSGGWHKGIIPQARWTANNSIIVHGPSLIMNTLHSSLRGYAVQSTAPGCVWPRWGGGIEAGCYAYPFRTDIYSTNAYAYAYAYLPGAMRTHGTKITALHQQQTTKSMFNVLYANVAPRGLSANSNLNSILASYPSQTKLSADYKLPFASVDWSGLCPAAYLRNFELTMHADLGTYSKATEQARLYSIGADLEMVLGNLLWIPFDTRIGITVDYNGGKSFDAFNSEAQLGRWYCGALFTIDL